MTRCAQSRRLSSPSQGPHPSACSPGRNQRDTPRSIRISRADLLALTSVCASLANACGGDSTAIFSCQASGARKFIELCVSSPVTPDGSLQYRFGTLDPNGSEKSVELVYPADRGDSLRHFVGATFTNRGIYTQSIRFNTATDSYTVFTRARGNRDEGAGVEVRNRSTGRITTVYCSERPRFYILELKGMVACDNRSPIGKACIR